MTTATKHAASNEREHAQKRIDRARAKGRKYSHHVANYALDYNAEICRKLRQKAAAFTSLTALLLWALTRDQRRQPLGKRYTTLRDWASLAGFTGNQTITELKRLHREGRVEYTGGSYHLDCGLWHPKHEGPRRDLGRVECRMLQVDETTWEASCEVDGNGVHGYGKGQKAAKQALARRLAACGLTGTLTK